MNRCASKDFWNGLIQSSSNAVTIVADNPRLHKSTTDSPSASADDSPNRSSNNTQRRLGRHRRRPLDLKDRQPATQDADGCTTRRRNLHPYTTGKKKDDSSPSLAIPKLARNVERWGSSSSESPTSPNAAATSNGTCLKMPVRIASPVKRPKAFVPIIDDKLSSSSTGELMDQMLIDLECLYDDDVEAESVRHALS